MGYQVNENIVIERGGGAGGCLDPIIDSDTMHYSSADVLKIPSEISDNETHVVYLYVSVSIQRQFFLCYRLDKNKLWRK